jgi:glycosyltransferase involved in cell wall biosynthesis
MARFADELERGLRDRAAFSVTSLTVRPWRIGARLGRPAADRHVSRYVRLPLAARRRRADVYHITDGAYGHVAALLPHDSTVATCHDLMLLRAEEGGLGFRGHPLSVLRYRWSASYLRRLHHVVFDSNSTRRDAIRLVGIDAGRASVVPPGVDSGFRPLADDERRSVRGELAPDGRRVVLHVSTGLPYKNVRATLRVVAALVETDVVELLRVSDARLVELYNGADVLLFPSHYEGFGWPPLEAMACGTPVVVSDCAPLREVIGDAGLAAPADDVAALTASVRRILESPELAAQLRAAGFRRASGFSWERTLDGYAELYRRVAAGRP